MSGRMLMKLAQYGALALLVAVAMFSFESKAFIHEFNEELDALIDGQATIHHDIQKGKYHKRGDIKITNLKLNEKQFIVSLRYKIKPKLFVPFPKKHQSGGMDQILPIEFATPEGYQLLERDGQLENDQATLVFEGREDIGKYKDAYKVKVLPISGKWWAYIWYHRDVKATGWLKVQMTIKKIKFIGAYTIVSKLRK